jgi:PAS domain S-box-containing protein
MAEVLRTGKPVRGIDAIAERPDGHRIAFMPFPSPLFDEHGQLTGAVNLLVDISDRTLSEQADQRLAAIVASSDDAIISKTLDGTITSWNAAAERMFGYTPDDIIGQSILTLIPADRRSEEDEIIAKLRNGQRVEHYETQRQRKEGALIDVSLTVSPIRDFDGRIVGASKISRDITDRKRSQEMLVRHAERLATLNRVARVISHDLDLDRIVQTVTDIATELAGARFGAFFYNVTDGEGESYQLYTLSGAPRSAFENFGMPRATAIFKPTFDGEDVIRSDDIRQDPRYGNNLPHAGMPAGHLPVVSYLAVPVKSSSGEVIGGLFFGHDQPGIFDADCETLISSVAAQAAVAMDNARLHAAAKTEIEQRKRAEAAKELLLAEIKHRVKNTLATVQAMASQTFKRGPVEERDTFVARLHALANAHDLLTEQGWDIVDITSVAHRALRPFFESDRPRIALEGPHIGLPSNKALLLAMVLHELSTNAVKYGALSDSQGRVRVDWSTNEAGALKLEWRETGGPPVSPPAKAGFGSRMIERALGADGGSAHFSFGADGLAVSMLMPL